jgi:hypothetical protein
MGRWSKLPVITATRREFATKEGVELEIVLDYEGEIHLTDSPDWSNNGTMTFSYPLCKCRTAPDDRWEGEWEPQPFPTEDASKEEWWWDDICRYVSYKPCRFKWWVEHLHGTTWDCCIEAVFVAPDPNHEGRWTQQHVVNTFTSANPTLRSKDEVYDVIRRWLHTIAMHEVDELLMIHGEQRYDPHAVVGRSRLAIYDDEGNREDEMVH